MSAVIAEREFRCGESVAHIRILTPKPDQQDWRCEYEICWPKGARWSYAMGIDSFQALQLAMFKIATDIGTSDEFKDGNISVYGEPMTNVAELNRVFPTPWAN